jgi:hypothetical protein
VLRLASDPPAPSPGRHAGGRKRLIEPETGRRGAPLRLTPNGRKIASAVAGWHDPVLTALGELDAGDKERALRLLLELIGALQRAGIVTVARMCVTCGYFRPDRHPGAPARHHCALLDVPLADADLRVDCPEHERAA